MYLFILECRLFNPVEMYAGSSIYYYTFLCCTYKGMTRSNA